MAAIAAFSLLHAPPSIAVLRPEPGDVMYRKFLTEALEVLGYYDGRGVVIERSSTTSREVAVHEAVHEQIFHKTVDGMLHQLVIRQLDEGGEVSADARSRFLIEDTLLAHEAAATFLGIQSLDSVDERAEAFASLPADYVGYYKVMGDVIGPLTQGTFLAYTLGWALAYWAFQSERILAVYEQGWPAFETIMEKVQSPTARMLLGVELLRERGREWLEAGLTAAAAAYSEDGTMPWDVHDDEQWRRHHSRDMGRFESHLSGALWRWLRDTVPIASTDVVKTSEGFHSWLMDGQGQPGRELQVIDDETFETHPDNELLMASGAALRSGRATILNSKAGSERIERMPTRDPLDRQRAVERIEKFSPAIYFAGSVTHEGRKWWAIYIYASDAVAGLRPGEHAIADRFLVAEDFAIAFIGHLQAVRGTRQHNGSLFMAPADAELLPYYTTKLQSVLAGLPSGGAQAAGDAAPDYPMWYWMGDWSDLLRPGTATWATRFQPTGTGIPESYILHLARKPDAPGYFFRFTSLLPGEAILRYEDALRAGNALGSMPDDEARRILDSLSGHISIIFDNWYVF